MFGRALDFRGGELKIANTRAAIFPGITLVRLQNLILEENPGLKNIIKEVGYRQGKDAVFFARKTGRETEVVKNLLESSKLMGLGEFKIIEMDKEKGKLVVHSNNSLVGDFYSRRVKGDFVRETKERFKTNEPVDFFITGLLEGVVESISGKEVKGKETKCIAKGDRYCEFIIEPKKKD